MIKKPLFFRISLSEKILLAQQLSLMIKSGLSIIEALSFLKSQSISKSLRYILESLESDLNKGQSLYSSLEKFHHQFGDFYINLIKVGETSGNLSQNLEYITSVLRRQQELKGKIITSLIYPLFIFSGTIIVTFLVVFIVFPKLMPVFTELKIKLPLITRIFIAVSTFILNRWYFFILFFIFLVFAFWLLLRNKKIKYFFDKLMIYLPLIGKINRYLIFINFSRNLAVLSKSGVDIVNALEISGKTTGNLFYQSISGAIIKMVYEGHNLKEAFFPYQKYFEKIFINLLEVGERTGELELTLNHLAEYYEQNLDNKLKTFTSLIEPILLAIMGIVVAFVALAIISPIYQITQEISK